MERENRSYEDEDDDDDDTHGSSLEALSIPRIFLEDPAQQHSADA
jgi:hypothetical protein